MENTENNVLIIDDDINFMNATSIVLEKYKIHLTSYVEPLAAFQELKENSSKYNVLVINYILSSVKGDEIVRLVREFNKDIYIILMSSHKELAPSIEIMRSLDIQAFFEKGSNFTDLILMIEGGFKYINQLNSIKQMSTKIEHFGIEFATAIRNMISARDKYTGEHSLRVTEYAKLFAENLKINEEDIKIITLAANFHDIGKIGISDAILLKPSKLTEEEYMNIKMHPIIGENILSTSEIFKDTLPIIRHHHERIDGNGYPDKLKGNNIPYYARLLSVCDTFDAITSKRVYSAEVNIDNAIQELIRVKNTQLDSNLVDAFVALINSEHQKIIEVLNMK